MKRAKTNIVFAFLFKWHVLADDIYNINVTADLIDEFFWNPSSHMNHLFYLLLFND